MQRLQIAFPVAMVLSLAACDMFKSKEAPDAGSPTPATPSVAATASTPTVDPAVSSLPPVELPPGTPPPPPGTKAVRLPDGGLALINDAGAVVTDAGRWPGFAVPSGLALPSSVPSGFAVPTAMPSGVTVPTGLPPIPSGFTLPPIPGMPSAKK